MSSAARLAMGAVFVKRKTNEPEEAQANCGAKLEETVETVEVEQSQAEEPKEQVANDRLKK